MHQDVIGETAFKTQFEAFEYECISGSFFASCTVTSVCMKLTSYCTGEESLIGRKMFIEVFHVRRGRHALCFCLGVRS